MLEYFAQFVNSVPEGWAFGIVLFVLLIAGLGLPFPEEIPLIFAGYLVHLGDIDLIPCIIACTLAILVGDMTLFGIGYKFGNHLFSIPFFSQVLSRNRLRKVNVYFRKYGNRLIFLARFMAGVRSATFLAAGILRMPFRRFIFFDGIGAIISAPLMIYLAYWFSSKYRGEVGSSMAVVRRTEKWILVFVLLGFVLLPFFWSWLRRNRRKKRRKEMKVENQKNSLPLGS